MHFQMLHLEMQPRPRKQKSFAKFACFKSRKKLAQISGRHKIGDCGKSILRIDCICPYARLGLNAGSRVSSD